MKKWIVCVSLLTLPTASWAALPTQRDSGAPYRSGEVLVGYRDGAATAHALKSEHGFTARSQLLDGRIELLALPSMMDVPGGIAMLSADSRVAFVEPNYLRRKLSVTPNDPLFNTQWGLSNTGQANFFADGPPGLAGGDLHMTSAWDLDGNGTADHTGTGSVTVAIVDDAVEVTHPDLAANVVSGYNFVDGNANPAPASDSESHGTSVAGCVAAVGNNGVGVAGVAWNEKLMPIKFGFDTASEASAFQFARNNGAKIVNASFGGPGWSQTELNAVNDLAAHDVLLVTSAGNEYANTDVSGATYPANYDAPNVLAVAATNRQDGIASFSNYGPTTVPVAAPGLQIVTTAIKGAYTTNPGVTGTSFSSPHAAGVAALIRDYANPANYSEIKARLIEGADVGVDSSNPVNQKTAAGRINAANSLSLTARPSLVIHPVVSGSYTQTSSSNGTQTVPIRLPAKIIDNNNGVLDAGETATLQISIDNLWQAATGVRGTLTATGGVTVAGGAVSFGDIASQGTATGSFTVTVPATITGHQYIDFALTLTANGGYSATRHFTEELGQLQNGVAITQTIQTNLQDAFHTWHIDVTAIPPDNQLTFTTTAANDIDIIVSYGAPAQYSIDLGAAPDATNPPLYYANVPNSQLGGAKDGNEKVTIAAPQIGTYYVTVVNFDRASNASYTLKAALAKPSLPSGGGAPAPFTLGILAIAAMIASRRKAARRS